MSRKLCALALLASTATGCLIYGHNNENAKPHVYAAIAAAEIATAALFSLAKDDDPNSDYSKTPYAGKVAIYVAGFELIDALGWLLVQPDHK